MLVMSGFAKPSLNADQVAPPSGCEDAAAFEPGVDDVGGVL